MTLRREKKKDSKLVAVYYHQDLVTVGND